MFLGESRPQGSLMHASWPRGCLPAVMPWRLVQPLWDPAPLCAPIFWQPYRKLPCLHGGHAACCRPVVMLAFEPRTAASHLPFAVGACEGLQSAMRQICPAYPPSAYHGRSKASSGIQIKEIIGRTNDSRVRRRQRLGDQRSAGAARALLLPGINERFRHWRICDRAARCTIDCPRLLCRSSCAMN